MNERDTKTIKIIILWVLVIAAVTEVAVMVDVGNFIDEQNNPTEVLVGELSGAKILGEQHDGQ